MICDGPPGNAALSSMLGMKAKYDCAAPPAFGRAERVEAERPGERELGVERVRPVEIAGKLCVARAKACVPSGYVIDAVDAPIGICSIAEFVLRSDADVARAGPTVVPPTYVVHTLGGPELEIEVGSAVPMRISDCG